MTTKEKYELIDKTKVSAKVLEILEKMEKASSNFTNAEVNSRVDTALDKIIEGLKVSKPEALLSVSDAKKEVKKEKKEAEEKNKGKDLSKKKDTDDKTGLPKKDTVEERKDIIKKESESEKEARERAKKELEKENEKAKDVIESQLEKLNRIILEDPALRGFNTGTSATGGGKSTPLIDAERKAIPRGRRVSQKGRKNQYGASAGGRVYWENRENRSDRKSPDYPTGKPYLAKGGMTENKTDVIKLYYHETSGGAEYLCSSKVKGSKDEGSFDSEYVVRIDGATDFGGELRIRKGGDIKRIILYYHKTNGGAEYLCSSKVKGSKGEGSFDSEFVVRIDGATDFGGELRISNMSGNKLAKGGNVYASDDLYEVKMVQDGIELDSKLIRARNKGEARMIFEDMYQEKYQDEFGAFDLEIDIAKDRMADGGFMANGGKTEQLYSSIKRDRLRALEDEISTLNLMLKKLENENNEESYQESQNLRKYKTILEVKKLNLEDIGYDKGGMMADGGKVDKRILEKVYEYYDIYKDGTNREHYYDFDNIEKVKEHIEKRTGMEVLKIKEIEIGRNYPDNMSHPYYHDDYEFELVKGQPLRVERMYGRPNYSGNVAYTNMIEVKNLWQMVKGGMMADSDEIKNLIGKEFRPFTATSNNEYDVKIVNIDLDNVTYKHKDGQVKKSKTSDFLDSYIQIKTEDVYMADGGYTESGEKLYEIANNMSDEEFQEAYRNLSGKEKDLYETLLRLGDEDKIALVSVLNESKKPKYDKSTWDLHRYAKGGLVEEIKMFDKYNYPTPKTKGDKVRAIFEQFKKKGYSTEQINTALSEINYAKGGEMADGDKTEQLYSSIKRDRLRALEDEIATVNSMLKKLENENTEKSYQESQNLREYKAILEVKKINLEDGLKNKGGYMADGGEMNKSGKVKTYSDAELMEKFNIDRKQYLTYADWRAELISKASKEGFKEKTNKRGIWTKKLAEGGETESEPMDLNESVYFEVYDGNRNNGIIKFHKSGSRIFETLLIGNVKAGNRKYMSYFTKNDLKSSLYRDFDVVNEVDEDYVNDRLKSYEKSKPADILVVKYPYPELAKTADTLTIIKGGEQVFDYDPITKDFSLVSIGLSYPDQIELDDFLEDSKGVSESQYTPELIKVIEVIKENEDINEIVDELKSKGLIKNYMMAEGGEVDFSERMTKMRNAYENLQMSVKGKIASAIGIDRAISIMENDYSIHPFNLIFGAVRGGLLELDEINEDLVNEAVYEAERVTDDYRDSGQGIGGSDMTYFTQNVLNSAGYKTGFINNTLKRVDADGNELVIDKYEMKF